MASDSWSSRLTSSRRYQYRVDLHDEADAEDDFRAEYMCPYCAEDFDIIGLCCHIDEEHPFEAKNGVCPVCAKSLGVDIVNHITVEHGSLLKVQRKRRLRKGGTKSSLSLLRKELQEGAYESLFGGSSASISSNTTPDPLLSSFISTPPSTRERATSEPVQSAPEVRGCDNGEQLLKSKTEPVFDEDQEETARRREFVQELMLSAILDDVL